MDIDEIVIENITRLMSAKGISQKQLADNAKINYQNLNRLLKQKRSIYKSDVLAVIAAYFKVTVTELTRNARDSDESMVFYQSAPRSPTPDRATLILAIQARLTTLDDSELGLVSGFLDDLDARRTVEISPTVRAK